LIVFKVLFLYYFDWKAADSYTLLYKGFVNNPEFSR